MTDRPHPTPEPDAERPAVRPDQTLEAQDAPLKQEGDALRDGSGSRHGQSPPNVDPGERR